MPKCYVMVKCTACLKEGYITYSYSPNLKSYTGLNTHALPLTLDIENNKSSWSARDCNFCRKTNTLQTITKPHLQTVTKNLPVLKGEEFLPVRSLRKDPVQLTDSEFSGIDDLEAELLAQNVPLDVIETDFGELQDPTITKPKPQVYKGAVSRVNSVSYSSPENPAGLGALKKHTVVSWEKVTAGSREEAQGKIMGDHFIATHLGLGCTQPKKWVGALVYKSGTNAKKALNATDFANVFLDNDPKLKGVFDGSGHSAMEWCHGLACSLGGANTYKNLYAASCDANTYSGAIEDWLRAKRNKKALFVSIHLHYEAGGKYPDVETRTSCRRAPAWVEYTIAEDNLGKHSKTFFIDARCIGFSRTDYDSVIAKLNTHFKTSGKDILD